MIFKVYYSNPELYLRAFLPDCIVFKSVPCRFVSLSYIKALRLLEVNKIMSIRVVCVWKAGSSELLSKYEIRSQAVWAKAARCLDVGPIITKTLSNL